jgi:hypothetical protein
MISTRVEIKVVGVRRCAPDNGVEAGVAECVHAGSHCADDRRVILRFESRRARISFTENARRSIGDSAGSAGDSSSPP